MRRCTLCRSASALTALTLSAGVGAQTGQAPTSQLEPTEPFRSRESYLQLHAGVTYTDNVRQSGDNPKGEMLASEGVAVDYTHQGSRFYFDSLGALKWIEYLEHTYDGTASGILNAKALFGTSEDVLQWAAFETFGQLERDPFAAPTPLNTENVNYFTTGPTLNFESGQNRLSVRGFYSRTDYQRSPYDSNGHDVGASLSHALSESSSMGVTADSRHTHFRYPLVASDYDVRSAFLSYTATVTRTRLTAETGYTILHYRDANPGSPLVSLGLDRRISSFSTIYLLARVGYATDVESIRTSAGLTTPSVAFAAASSPNPQRQESVSLGWNLERARTTVSLFGSLARQKYRNQSVLDHDNVLLQLLLLRRLSPTVSAILSVQHQTNRYTRADTDTTQTDLSTGISKTFYRLGLSLRYDHFHRGGSSSGGAPIVVYHENRFGLYLTYDLLGHHLSPLGLAER
jgi:hypothetical protein